MSTTKSSQEIIQAHKNLQHAIYEFDRYKRSVVSDVYFLRQRAQQVEDAKKDLPVESIESQDKINYVEAAEAHLAECLAGTATNSPRPAGYQPKPVPNGAVAMPTGENQPKLGGTGGLQKF